MASRSATLRWARVLLIAGAMILASAVALIVWDASTSDDTPVVITG